jgi:hypothetical protein
LYAGYLTTLFQLHRLAAWLDMIGFINGGTVKHDETRQDTDLRADIRKKQECQPFYRDVRFNTGQFKKKATLSHVLIK